MNAEQILIRFAAARKRVKFSAGSNGREVLFVGDVNGIFEFNNAICEAFRLGEELTPKGKWVDFDPSKFTCDKLPITGRVSNSGIAWCDQELIGYSTRVCHPFLCNSGSFKHFQIWEAEQ